MKRFPITDIAVSVIILVLIAVTLAPAIGRLQRDPADAKCQSNLKMWAKAMDLYLADNERTYPTNHYLTSVPIVPMVPLSPPSGVDSDGKPLYFVSGANWVEALYPYLWDIGKKTDADWKSYRACLNSSSATYPANKTTPCMTYAFNRNLCENPRGIIRDGSKLMMLREMDRRAWSVLRPIVDSTNNGAYPPMAAFLTRYDIAIGSSTVTNPQLHGNGSYIAFADGHVRWFSTDYYPKDQLITNTRSWDAETNQWYNYGPGSKGTVPDDYIKSIAISP